MLYGEDLGGPLITRVGRIMDLAGSKYACTIRSLSDEPPYPRESLSETIVNALAHNDYSQRVPVTFTFSTESLTAVSCYGLPPENTEESVLNSGESIPGNPTLAEVLRIAGLMGLEGTGLESLRGSDEEQAASFRIYGGRFTAEIPSRCPFELEIKPRETTQEEKVKEILRLCDVPEGARSSDLVFLLGIPSGRVTKLYMSPLRKQGLLEFTIPEKPTCKMQRYRTTAKGRSVASGRRR